MKTATGLMLVTAGGILALAVTAHPPFFNLQIAGLVLILAGIAGLILPRRGNGWLRRRTVLRRVPAGRASVVEEQRYPPYVMLNLGPASPAAEPVVAGSQEAARPAGEAVRPGEEVVEEFVEDR